MSPLLYHHCTITVPSRRQDSAQTCRSHRSPVQLLYMATSKMQSVEPSEARGMIERSCLNDNSVTYTLAKVVTTSLLTEQLLQSLLTHTAATKFLMGHSEHIRQLPFQAPDLTTSGPYGRTLNHPGICQGANRVRPSRDVLCGMSLGGSCGISVHASSTWRSKPFP